MSTLDARIMRFISRKETEFPELKQPSVIIYQSLTTEIDEYTITRELIRSRKTIGSPLQRLSFTV